MTVDWTCGCEDCKNSEDCNCCCDLEDACAGCREAREIAEDARFDIDCATGRI